MPDGSHPGHLILLLLFAAELIDPVNQRSRGGSHQNCTCVDRGDCDTHRWSAAAVDPFYTVAVGLLV